MSCIFVIETKKNIATLFSKALKEGSNYDFNFTGNQEGGYFIVNALGGAFKGRFTVRGNQLEFFVSDKPFFISCSVIKTFLRNYLA